MALDAGLVQRPLHQRRADALALMLAVDGDRPQQQCGACRTGDHIPQADGADQPALVHRRR